MIAKDASSIFNILSKLPSHSGAYALVLRLTYQQQLRIGMLGEFEFPAGDYIYFGSARGRGGIRARLGRHILGSAKTHWHIDYLRQVGTIAGYYFIDYQMVGFELTSRIPLECAWSKAASDEDGFVVVVPRFGASDCVNRCDAHLFYLMPPLSVKYVENILMKPLKEYERRYLYGRYSLDGVK